MKRAKGQIARDGKVRFGNASLNVCEEGIPRDWRERQVWEKAFKHQVFKRIIQTLNRIGWKCVIPQDKIDQYSQQFAEGRRYCVKGDLKADLSISGRCIELNFFQNVNAPDRPDHEGRYQYDKQYHMPYLLRLEMERTRRRIITYLCNVFSGYESDESVYDGRSRKCGPKHLTAFEWLAGCYETSWHFKGDLDAYEISAGNSKSADGDKVCHGKRVWFADRKGRICTGIAYYNINNMWWVITGKYGHTNIASFDLHTKQPEDIRRKRNEKLRCKILNKLMATAAADLNFERAALLRDLLANE